MADLWSDPTAAGAVYADPTAPVYVAPIMLTEPDPVYRDDALFASSAGNWRAAPVPPPPLPILNEAGELVVMVEPPTPAELRDQAVAALHAPPAGPARVASRGGARSTYSAPAPARSPGGRRTAASAGRPAGSVTSSPATWLPDTRSADRQSDTRSPDPRLSDPRRPDTYLPDTQLPGRRSSTPTAAPPPAPSGRRPPGQRGPWGADRGARTGPFGNAPTPTVPWRASPPPATWQPTPSAPPNRPTSWVPTPPGPGPATYRARTRATRSARSGRRRNKGWIPGLIVVALVVVADVAPHLGGLFGSHKAAPAAVTDAVDGYYSDLERGNVAGADALICDARRATFVAGSTDSGSDVNRGITSHTVTSARTAGGGKFTVHVDVTSQSGTSGPATITVVHEDGAYHLCGGTTP